MSDQPINTDRPNARATVLALTAGTVVAVALFAIGFVLRYVGDSASADTVGTIAVVALLLTPAVALATTAVELRRAQGLGTAMAILVLLILAGATVLALLVSH